METEKEATIPPGWKLVRSGYLKRKPEPNTKFEIIGSSRLYHLLLQQKLKEEQGKFSDALLEEDKNSSRVKDEAADVLEATDTAREFSNMTEEQLRSIQEDIFERAGLLGIGKEEILEYQTMKRIELGGFSMGVVLIEEKKAA